MIKCILIFKNKLLKSVVSGKAIKEEQTELKIGLLYDDKNNVLQIGGKNQYLIEYIAVMTQYFEEKYTIKNYKNCVSRIVSTISIENVHKGIDKIRKNGETVINVESLERLMR